MKFHAGDFSLDDAPWVDRPVEIDGDRIETLIERNQCYTTQEKTNILKISKSISYCEMKKCVFYFTEKVKHGFWQTQ